MTNVQVKSVSGDTALRTLRYENSRTGEITEYQAAEGDTFGLFVFAGYAPATDLVRGVAELSEEGYIVTDRQQKTSVEGLYAAGDVCVKNLRQVVTAVGDGRFGGHRTGKVRGSHAAKDRSASGAEGSEGQRAA